MPGTKRKLRLVVDWTVSLLFDRDTSELGQLGHPPTLERHAAATAAPAEPPAPSAR
jgi:NADH dehydrogenase